MLFTQTTDHVVLCCRYVYCPISCSNLRARLQSPGGKRPAAILQELGHVLSYRLRIDRIRFYSDQNAGGGGERVLWTAIASIQGIVSVVYTGDTGTTKEPILDKVKSRFAISLDLSTIHFVFLASRKLVEDSSWPRFTLLGQSIGSMYLVWEAMSFLIPDLYIGLLFPRAAQLRGDLILLIQTR
ncbi:hypothetical protein ARMGADRAFT_1076450 [Armillaria gallica]|uniref:ALG11 mannosyltransferase N-terminal domain-containing protein n=1 Tax=Armillaria gallica TaxID=47427 RepID=A0A2H3DS06_ARMGA|nr:hypothetical protein ARMGADRAFT_1076450 [Armillaria gallica]